MSSAAFSLKEFQRNILDDSTLLIEFFLGEQTSYAWTVSSSEIKSYVLPSKKIIGSKVQSLRELIASYANASNESAEKIQRNRIEFETKYWETARELSLDLFGKLGEELNRERLIIIPDGDLY